MENREPGLSGPGPHQTSAHSHSGIPPVSHEPNLDSGVQFSGHWPQLCATLHCRAVNDSLPHVTAEDVRSQ